MRIYTGADQVIHRVQNKSGRPVAVISGAELSLLIVFAGRLRTAETEYRTSREFWNELHSLLAHDESESERGEAMRLGRDVE